MSEKENSGNRGTDEYKLPSEKLSRLPAKPGIYQFKNSRGKVIYIGKAINLRNRVRSYFRKKATGDAKTKAMINKIADLELIVTDSEAEALILEDTLIKKIKPRYNISLRDDKTYPYVRITNEDYPRIFITRMLIKDGSKYIGPFTEVRHLRQVMRLVRSLFYLRSCRYPITDETIKSRKYKLCLDYHINKCEGVCEGLVSKEHYNRGVQSSIEIINGKTKFLEKQFRKEMEQAAEKMDYEGAAKSRNRLIMLQSYTEKQKIVTVDMVDRDIIGISRIDDLACSLILKVREGKLIGKRHYIINDVLNLPEEAIIQRTLEKWYPETEFIPKEIFLPNMPEETKFIMDWLEKKRGRSLKMTVPEKGDKKKLVTMASINAEYILREHILSMTKKEQTASRAVLSLQRDIRLSKPPLRIECFDNSHIQGSDYVSSVVVFVDGKPKKKDYRKFKMKTVKQNDDYAAMREVIHRRYSSRDKSEEELPDLIIIDGGKGQLSSAVKILKELELYPKISVIGLAKRLEEVFLPDKSESIMLPRTSSSLRLIQFLRDEAHRFAITYHRTLRRKRTLKTELTSIEGVGEKTARKLLVEFGSIDNIKKLDAAELKTVVNNKVAGHIYKYYNKQDEKQSE